MAIYQTQTTSFKAELYQGIHNLLVDTINIALYTNGATLDENTQVYDPTNPNEVAGTGYVVGGKALTGVTVMSSGNVAYVSFNSVSWDPAAFTCRGALIYNVSQGNKSIAVLDFGMDKTAVNTFTVQMPVNGPSTALIRSA